MATQPPLFPEAETQTGKPAEWRQMSRKQTQLRSQVARVQGELLQRGWRLRLNGAEWIATHPVHGRVRALRSELLLKQVRAREKSGYEVARQLSLF